MPQRHGDALRRPSRSLEVFSISALDLFASSLGAFILVAVVLFPYYLKNSDVVRELMTSEAKIKKAEKTAKAAEQNAQAAAAEAEKLRAENAKLKKAAAAPDDRVRALEKALAEARKQLASAEEKSKTPEQAAGKRTLWLYGDNEVVVYEYPGREAGGTLMVGIFTKVRPGAGFKIGGIAMLAVRRGTKVSGDLWAFDPGGSCFLRSFALHFTAAVAADGRSMSVTRDTATVRGTSGSRGPCVLSPDASKRFDMRRAD